MELGLKIKQIRQEKNIKQEELALFLDISQGQLSKIENGSVIININQLIDITNYTKTNLMDFFPENLVHIQQLDFKLQLQELIQENKEQKDVIKLLLKTIKSLESAQLQLNKSLSNLKPV